MSKILGIDLGTTNSAMSIVEGGEPKIIENKEGSRTTPSVVAVTSSGERLVGQIAKRQAVTNPKNTIYSAKRFIGRRFADEEVQRDKAMVSFEVKEGSGGGVEIKMGDKWMTPPEISAMVLGKLKADAEAHLGEKIEDAIITVPAYFDDSQRQATKDAGKIAGFNVKRIINEPTAAALAYGLNKKKDEKVLVYDLGGGTFDVSILEIGGGAERSIEVLATSGDTHLGGDDFDQRIIKWLIDEFKKDQGVDLSKDQNAIQRLKESAEKAKHELSTVTETEINQPYITMTEGGPKHLNLKMTRAKLEELVDDLVQKTMEPVRQALTDAKMDKGSLDEIILVGGQTRMPAVQKLVKDFFGKEPNQSINPDEVVALGAAAQGGVMQGDVKDVLLLDVTPLSLGIETLGGVDTKLIEKNTTIPTSKTQTFSTAADNQPSVEIKVLQGERPMADDNKLLGRFILDGIPPAPRGVPQIEVKFDIDANGILNVSAKDRATNREQKIVITASSGLSKEEVERMKQEAEKHADEDKKKRESIDIKNNAESLIFQSEKVLKDAGDKVKDDLKRPVQEKIDALKKVLAQGESASGGKDGEDLAAIKKATEELSTEIQKVGAEMYKQAGPNPANPTEPNPGKPDDKKTGDDGKGPVEGEYKEVPKKDK